MKPSQRSNYHRMSIGEKQAAWRESQREPALRCIGCGAGVMAADMLSHLERCQRPAPHPHERWLRWRDARELGFSRADLFRLADRGVLRTTGTPKRKLYLARDVVQVAATRRWLAGRRRP